MNPESITLRFTISAEEKALFPEHMPPTILSQTQTATESQ